jgi:uncharacterized protein
MFEWLKRKQPEIIKEEPKSNSGFFFSTDLDFKKPYTAMLKQAMSNTFQKDVTSHLSAGVAQDSVESVKESLAFNQQGLPIIILSWFGSQSFIGYQACAMIAQQWLVMKACAMPARDAIRKGYEFTVNDGTEIKPEVLDKIRKYDDKFKLNEKCLNQITFGRIFGIRIAMFVVESTDPLYYEKPFNLDGITPNSYKGITQIDPYWITPELSQSAASDPSSLDFYEPTYWSIGNIGRIHNSHLIIFKGEEVPDILKPSYIYGGLSIPQKIYERVYAAERTANEAPQLAMTKRTNVMHTDVSKALADQQAFENRLATWAMYRDNYGVKVLGTEETTEQLDTSLADLDSVIMTQYQLVAAIANVPATKLLGTTPKGFNATGEYEEASYHEELESIQTHDIKPLLTRHYQCLLRSKICPEFGIEPFDFEIVFNPLDAMTAEELAMLNKTKADTDVALANIGAIDGTNIRERLINDPQSGYNGISDEELIEEPIESETNINANESIQKTAMNGAQVSSLIEILETVANGQLPRDSGIEAIKVAFNMSEEDAESLMATIGKGFVSTPESPILNNFA